MVTGSVRTPELPHELLADTVMFPPLLPQRTNMEVPLDGPMMDDPAGTDQL